MLVVAATVLTPLAVAHEAQATLLDPRLLQTQRGADKVSKEEIDWRVACKGARVNILMHKV